MDSQNPKPNPITLSDPELAAQIAQAKNINSKYSEPVVRPATTAAQPHMNLPLDDQLAQVQKIDTSPNRESQTGGRPQPYQTGEPKKAMTDADAQAILATFNAQNKVNSQPERKLPMGMIFTIITLIVLVIVASSLIGLIKSKSNSNSSGTNSSGQNNSPTNETSNQINNDVKSCQKPEVAIAEC